MQSSIDARPQMLSFWQRHSQNADEKEMMLDDAAEQLGLEEIPEVLSNLPDLNAKDVLELGAGIGRFTGKLAMKARSVLAIDFMETFVKKNKETNGNLPNVAIRQCDVTEFDLEPNSMDVVFSNWLLMYLTDQEVFDLLHKILTWLRPGGHLFFRESCFRPGGNSPNKPDPDMEDEEVIPTVYRSPKDYVQIIENMGITNDNKCSFYEIISQRPLQTYIKHKQLRDQLCWLMLKTSDRNRVGGYQTTQEFLHDKLHEKIHDPEFGCSGAREITKDTVRMLNLRQDDHVLEIGCGTGESAFHLAENYGVHVWGIDISADRVCTALNRLNAMNLPNLQLEVCDIMKRELPEAFYDVIYINGTGRYVADKKDLFKRCWHWLKPGGHLLIIDLCSAVDKQPDKEVETVSTLRGHIMKSQQAYSKMLGDVGFLMIITEDRTEQLRKILKVELKQAEIVKNDLIREFSVDDFMAMVDGWRNKLKLVESGAIHLSSFYVEKPI